MLAAESEFCILRDLQRRRSSVGTTRPQRGRHRSGGNTKFLRRWAAAPRPNRGPGRAGLQRASVNVDAAGGRRRREPRPSDRGCSVHSRTHTVGLAIMVALWRSDCAHWATSSSTDLSGGQNPKITRSREGASGRQHEPAGQFAVDCPLLTPVMEVM